MNVGIEQLHEKIVLFREAIESADFSKQTVGEEANSRMRKFPNSACDEACTILGIYLKNELEIEPLSKKCSQIEKDGRWYGMHHWLEFDEYIIDITADQFPMVNDTVLFTKQSPFHNEYAKEIGSLTNSFVLEDEPYWIESIYKSVMREFEN